MSYDYKKALIEDIKKYIVDNYMEPEPGMSKEDYLERLQDELWDVDEVTGNGAYYYASEEECEQYIGYGIKYFIEAIKEFGFDWCVGMKEVLEYVPARCIDTCIRTYLLYQCIEPAVDSLNYKFDKE